MALPALPSDEALLATLGDLQSQQPRLKHRLEAFTVDPDPNPDRFGNDTSADQYDGGSQATRTLGPFLDELGRRVVVDVYTSFSPAYIPVRFASQSEPLMWIANPNLISSSPSNIVFYTLTPASGTTSSIWIAASVFASGSLPTDAVGLRISQGLLRIAGFSLAVARTHPNPIILPDTATVSLRLTIPPEVPQSATTPSNPQVSVQTPTQVTFALNGTSGTLSASDDLSVTILGTSLSLSLIPAPASYDGLLDRISFLFKADKSQVLVIDGIPHLAQWSGQADITAASWSVPLSRAPNDDSTGGFFQASGAGGISIVLAQGLTAAIEGQSRPVQCGPCTLLVNATALAIAGSLAQGGQSRKVMKLQDNSSALFVLPSPFQFRYVRQNAGQEAWSVVPQRVNIRLERLRTVNDIPFDFIGFRGRLSQLKESGVTSSHLQTSGFVDTPRPQTWSLALRNLLLRTVFPSITIYGEFDGSAVLTGILNLNLGIRSLVPFLPDPYASNITNSIPGVLKIIMEWKSDELIAITKISIVLEKQRSDAPEASTTSPPTLLDLSTKISQLGVAFVLEGQLAVNDLYLSLPTNEIGLMTLPAVQWEPVITIPNPGSFPSPLGFPSSGPNVLISSQNSVTLTPVAPRQALDSIVSLYNAVPSSDVNATFTLPFGLVADARLSKSIIPLFPSPSLSNFGPSFSTLGLRSADQISIHAPGQRFTVDGHFPSGAVSHSIPGTVSLPHQPSDTTVLDKIQGTFDTSFTQGSGIPVTRIDISGFGESVLSDWRDTTSLPPNISKVAFDVFVGRTAKEVVQASSILYPYGVAVVREITIERQNSGVVLRHDSGWQASSDGRYQFPVPAGASKLIVHPGLVKGVVNVRNIRDLRQNQLYTIIDATGNIDLMPVKFDCTVDLENVVLGGSPGGVLALDQLGYVQITKLPGAGSLNASQYATLLHDRGPLGGLIDCTTNIGQSGLLMRVLKIEHAAAPSASDIQFVAAACGTPILPTGGSGAGQWAFVVHRRTQPTPQPLDAARGVPLVQQNASTSALTTLQSYRFADPGDLLVQVDPETDYGLVFSTPANRVLFERPKIEPASPFEISSVLLPYLADAFSLSTSAGPFPPVSSCIQIKDPNWRLAISSDAQLKVQLRLQLTAPTFTTDPARRILQDNPNTRSVAYTANEQTPPQPSVVTLAIDSASNSWSCKITNLSFAMETNSFGEVLRVVGTVDGSSNHPPQYTDTRLVFGPKLGAATKLVSFLQDFGAMPALDVFFGSFKASGVMNLQKALSLPGLGAFTEFIDTFVIDLDFKVLMNSSETESTMEIGMDITFKLPIGIYMVVWLGAVDVKMAPTSTVTNITAGVGYGYNVQFLPKPLEAYAYAAVALHLVTGDGVFGFGVGVLIKMDIDLVVIEASATSELRGDMLHITCGTGAGDKSLWAVGQITIALEISIFLVLDIEFDYQHEWSTNTDHGPCPLVDVL